MLDVDTSLYMPKLLEQFSALFYYYRIPFYLEINLCGLPD